MGEVSAVLYVVLALAFAVACPEYGASAFVRCKCMSRK